MSAIGTKRTSACALHMSAFGGKADMTFCTAKCLLMTQSGHSACASGCLLSGGSGHDFLTALAATSSPVTRLRLEPKHPAPSCPLLAQSGHRLVCCICLLLTQSGHCSFDPRLVGQARGWPARSNIALAASCNDMLATEAISALVL